MFYGFHHFVHLFTSRRNILSIVLLMTNLTATWNKLPDDIPSAKCLTFFRSKHKSCLFTKAYPPQFLLFLSVFMVVDPLHLPRYLFCIHCFGFVFTPYNLCFADFKSYESHIIIRNQCLADFGMMPHRVY